MKKPYTHLLRAMRKGDVLYLPDPGKKLDRAVTSSFCRGGGKVETSRFIATNMTPILAHGVVRITCIEPLKD